MLHSHRGHSLIGVLCLDMLVTCDVMGTVLPGAVLEQVAIQLVLVSLGHLYSVPRDVACSVCGGQCQVRHGVEAQDAALQTAVALDARES